MSRGPVKFKSRSELPVGASIELSLPHCVMDGNGETAEWSLSPKLSNMVVSIAILSRLLTSVGVKRQTVSSITGSGMRY